MKVILAKPTKLLVIELWGIGDVVLALPFLKAATRIGRVCLLAKPHAEPILAAFAPEVQLIPLTAPWTAFSSKYQLHRWPWKTLMMTLRILRREKFGIALSARVDPRDHILSRLVGAEARIGFPRLGSGLWLSRSLPPPASIHRSAHWAALASTLGLKPAPAPDKRSQARHAVIHTGAAMSTRRWPADRFQIVADRLRAAGWSVEVIDDTYRDLPGLIAILQRATLFIGNDSGPGHLAAAAGVHTFTIFSNQLPTLFAPQHPRAEWIEGAPCPYKPCFDTCHFEAPHCLLSVGVEDVWQRLANVIRSDP